MDSSPDRDRDAAGRARNARPRDGLGRPLPYGAPGEERAPEGVVRTPAAALAEAQALLDAGRPFHAHEVLEDSWKSAPEPERRLWRGLAQVAVGLTHAARGNAKGAATLIERGAGNIAPYAADPPHGVAVDALVRWAADGGTGPLPRLTARSPAPGAEGGTALRAESGRVGPGSDAEHTAHMTSPATAPGAERTRELWSAGDYQRVGVRLVPASEQLVADLQVRPGERLLDVGGGTGNTALAAARRDADVVCTDIVPEMLEYARRRAEMEGLSYATEIADAQALPYDDGSFDVVTSTIGVVFAADADKAAAEIVRVLRPGGRFGLTAWVPQAPGGKLLQLVRQHDPRDHPGDPLRWGTRDGVAQLFARHGVQLRYAERTTDFTAPSPEVQWQRYIDWYAPVRVAWERLDEPGRRAFHDEFVEMWGSYSRGSPGILVPNTYLQVIGTKS